MAGKGSKLHGSVAAGVSTLQQECSPVEYTAALKAILRIHKNVQNHPGEGSYKQIKKTNKAFSEKVWMFSGGQQIMYSIGWTDLDDTIVLLDSHKVTAAITLIEACLQNSHSGRTAVSKSSRSAKSGQAYQSGWAKMAAGKSTGWTGGSNLQSGGSNDWSRGSNGWSGGNGTGGGYGGCVCGQCGYDDDESDDDDGSDDDESNYNSWQCSCGQCGTNAGRGSQCVCGQCGESDCGSWTSTYQTQKTKTTVTRKPARKARATGSSYGGGRSYGSSGGYGGGSYSSGGYGGDSYSNGGYGGGSYGGYGGGASCGTGGG